MLKLTLPIVNLNGDTASTLVKQAENVTRALQHALNAIQDAAPHGRNFQLNPSDYSAARKEFETNLRLLQDVRDYYEGLLESVYESMEQSRQQGSRSGTLRADLRKAVKKAAEQSKTIKVKGLTVKLTFEPGSSGTRPAIDLEVHDGSKQLTTGMYGVSGLELTDEDSILPKVRTSLENKLEEIYDHWVLTLEDDED